MTGPANLLQQPGIGKAVSAAAASCPVGAVRVGTRGPWGDGDWYPQFSRDTEQILLGVMKAGLDVTWESVGDYLDTLAKKRGINVGALIGHSGIRRYVIGEASGERVQATSDEMAAMKKLVREAMYAGALGFSTAPKDRGDPAGVCDDERWALASELGTGIFQVAGGAPGGTAATREVARPGGTHREALDLQSRLAAAREPR
jgi:hypothetical protein